MLSALVYLQFHSFRNRLTSRITRLKQPKYLVGAIAGGLYFYFYFFRYLFFPRRHSGDLGLGGGGHGELLELLGALLLMVVVLLAWIIPNERAALVFSEAEVAFLFPAPITRKGLIHFKLLRSQFRIFFTVLFLSLVSNRFGGNGWVHAAGWWLILSTLNLHFLGSSFARTMLMDKGISNWLRRGLVLLLAFVGGVGVILWARRSLPEGGISDTRDFNAVLDYIQTVLTTGPAQYLLYPFRVVARPFFAKDPAALLHVLGPSLLIILAHYFWVVWSDVAFEEASLEASQRTAARVTAVRSGNWQAMKKNRKGRRPWFRLIPVGPPAVALFWKNLISAGQAVTWRIWISLTVMCGALYFGFIQNAHSQDIFMVLAMLMGVLLGWSLLIGPQFLRQDFRQDLMMADTLKTLPMSGWQVALGELLAPVVLLAAFQWLALLFAAFFLLSSHAAERTFLLAISVGAALLLPVMDGLLFVIPNAAVLLFPSWFQVSREGPRGIEATGQRLVFLFGQLLLLALALIPAAAVFALVFFALRLVLGNTFAVPCACFASAILVAGEGVLGVLLVGKLFDRFDVSELNP